MLTVDQALVLQAAHTDRDLEYLPLPNRVDFVHSSDTAPASHTRAAFVLPFRDTGELIMANNIRRGLEYAGGHVEKGESLRAAAIREAFEEVGCHLSEVVPIGFLRMITLGEKPEGYQYPFPVSFQQFFVARASEMVEYQPNDECGMPAFITGRLAARRQLSPSRFAIYTIACQVMFFEEDQYADHS